MSFKEKLLEDSKYVFLNDDEFSEKILYIPSSGNNRIIDAIVIRQGLEPGAENVSRSLRKQAEIYIANDSDTGVIEIDKKDDRIKLKDIEGTIREARINEILHKDDGMWHLLIGW